MYDIDRFKKAPEFNSIMATDDFHKRPKSVGGRSRRNLPEIEEISMYNLEKFCTMLGHTDVNRNLSLHDRCEECDDDCDKDKPNRWFVCDGCYPSNAGLEYPINGLGNQNKCHRGVICQQCFDLDEPPITRTWKRHGGFYFCSYCCRPPGDVFDVWGQYYIEPQHLLSEGSIHPSNPPTIFDSKPRQPADFYDIVVALREEKNDKGQETYSRYGGHTALAAASSLMGAFKQMFLPKSQQAFLLKHLHEMHEEKLLLVQTGTDDVQPKLLIPKDMDAFEGRANCVQITENEVYSNRIKVHTGDIQMNSDFAEIFVGDVPRLIQEILLDVRLDPKTLFMSANGLPNAFYDELGDIVRRYSSYARCLEWRKISPILHTRGNNIGRKCVDGCN